MVDVLYTGSSKESGESVVFQPKYSSRVSHSSIPQNYQSSGMGMGAFALDVVGRTVAGDN